LFLFLAVSGDLDLLIFSFSFIFCLNTNPFAQQWIVDKFSLNYNLV
jgi:hypothetical protein